MLEPPVTIIVLTWNSRRHIDGCLTTMLRQTYPNYQILVVDSHSNDGTSEYIRTNYPEVEVIELPQNLGYRRGNSIGMKAAKGEFVVVCNDDVRVDGNWLSEMVKAMDYGVGLVTPMILMEHDDRLVNAAGNTLHYSGMCGPRGKGEPREKHEEQKAVAAVSGCCFMIRRELMLQLGGFSPDFDRLDVGWHASFEDVDLSWRALMLGYRTEYAPKAVMYHKYEQPSLFFSRFGSYEWGRYLTFIRNYSALSLFVLAPLFLLQEVMAWAYALLNGKPFLLSKASVMKWLFMHPRDLLGMRTRVQEARLASDYFVVRHLDATLCFLHKMGKWKLSSVVHCMLRAGSLCYYWILVGILQIRHFRCKESKASAVTHAHQRVYEKVKPE